MGLVEDSVSRLGENGVTSAWCAIRFADMRLASLERVAARTAMSAAAMMAPGMVADDCARDAAAAGAPLSTVPGALFLCGHNAGRSQMSAAFASHFAGPGFAAYSGGSTPVAEVNPVVLEAMATEGISMADCFPKPWTEEVGVADNPALLLPHACTVLTRRLRRSGPDHRSHAAWMSS